MELAPGDVVCVPLGRARGDRRGVGRQSERPIRASTTGSRTSRRSSTFRRSSRSCATSSTGCRTTRSRPRGMVLRMCLRMGEHLGPERERVGVRLAGPPPRAHDARAPPRAGAAGRRARARQERGGGGGGRQRRRHRRADRRGHAGDAGAAAEPVARAARSRFRAPDFSPAQREAADALRATIAQGGYAATLIDGVTGSGKTEVYFEAVAETIRRGRQALILMPEIALTAQFLDRFAAALRRAPGGMAFAAHAAQARAHLGGGRGRRGERRRRRALGAVSALRRSRPDRRR